MTTTTLSPGLYGERGWTTRNDAIKDLLEANSIDIVRGFSRFVGLAGELAQQMLDTFPDQALDDRQNHAPTLETLLRMAAESPDVTLDGYVVGEERTDERLSVDAITLVCSYVPDDAVTGHDYATDNPDADFDEPNPHWTAIRTCVPAFKDEPYQPDEMELVKVLKQDDGSVCGKWLLWWD